MQLVTGATGIVGARLLFDLAGTGKPVKAIKGLSGNMELINRYLIDRPELLQNIIWIEGDLRNPDFVYKALKDCTEVYHCAARVSFDSALKNEMYEINVGSTANIVNSCIENNIKKLCYVSSVAAIGRDNSGTLITENKNWTNSGQNTAYALSKRDAELEVWRGIHEGLSSVIVNPTVILGRGNWNTGSAAIFKKIWDGIPFCPPGANGFVDVRDVSAIMIKLMNSEIEAERFILCSENSSYKNLISKIAQIYGIKPNLKPAGKLLMELAWRGSRMWSMLSGQSPMLTKETVRTTSRSYFYSSEKLKNAIGFEFIPLEETIRYYAQLFLQDRKLKSKRSLPLA